MTSKLLALTLLIFLQCNDQKKSAKTIPVSETAKILNKSRFITYDEIKTIPFDQFVDRDMNSGMPEKYQPITMNVFIVGDWEGWTAGIRSGLSYIYQNEDLTKKDILIREVTWESSLTENLTIWYERKNMQWIPVDHFVWKKDADY